MKNDEKELHKDMKKEKDFVYLATIV